MSHIKSQLIEITKMFDLLNKLTHIRRRILFGDNVRLIRWLMDQGVEAENKEANVSNLKIIKFY